MKLLLILLILSILVGVGIAIIFAACLPEDKDIVDGISRGQPIEQESIYFIGRVGSDAELYEYSGFFTTCFILVGNTVEDDFAALSCDH